MLSAPDTKQTKPDAVCFRYPVVANKVLYTAAADSLASMSYPSIFYHYTSLDGLAGILDSRTILASTPHPATPGMVGGSYVKDGAVFLTRMDPANSRRAIAFNNYR